MNEVIKLDKDLFIYLNNLGSPSWDLFWLFVTCQWSWVPLYLIIIIVIIKSFGWKRSIFMISFLIIIFAFTDQITGFLKYSFQRLRPCYDESLVGLFRLVKDSCGGKFGFTSGHAGNSFGFAFGSLLLLRKKFLWYPFIIVIWAFIVSYSRIYVGVHFPLDLIFGAIFGATSAFIFYLIYRKVVLLCLK